jgi:hypothetical protein
MDDRILYHLAGSDEIWHAGDWGVYAVAQQLKTVAPLRGVYGNIDGQDIRIEYPKVIRFNCEDVKVCITHIGGYPGRYAPDIRESLKAGPPDLFICGHSHILKVMRDPKLNLLHINPGAAGRSGFHKVRTLVRFEVERKEIKNLRVVELGPRTEITV